MQALLGRDGSGRWVIERPQGPGETEDQLCPRHGPALINQIQPCPFSLSPSDKGLIWVRVVEVWGGDHPTPSIMWTAVSQEVCSNNACWHEFWQTADGRTEWFFGERFRPAECEEEDEPLFQKHRPDFYIHGSDLKFNFSNNHRHLKFLCHWEIRLYNTLYS